MKMHDKFFAPVLGIFLLLNLAACTQEQSQDGIARLRDWASVYATYPPTGKIRQVNLKKWQYFIPKNSELVIDAVYLNVKSEQDSSYAHVYKCREIIDEKNTRSFYLFEIGKPAKYPRTFGRTPITCIPTLLKKDIYKPKNTSFKVRLPIEKYIPEGSNYVFGKMTWMPNVDCGNE